MIARHGEVARYEPSAILRRFVCPVNRWPSRRAAARLRLLNAAEATGPRLFQPGRVVLQRLTAKNETLVNAPGPPGHSSGQGATIRLT